MGTYAKTIILLLLLLYLHTFTDLGAISAKSAISEDMIEVKMSKLKLEVEVDTIRDYSPVIPNPKHNPPPPREKSGTSARDGGGGR